MDNKEGNKYINDEQVQKNIEMFKNEKIKSELELPEVKLFDKNNKKNKIEVINDDSSRNKEIQFSYCPSCGNKIDENNNFCTKCGYKNVIKKSNDYNNAFILSLISILCLIGGFVFTFIRGLDFFLPTIGLIIMIYTRVNYPKAKFGKFVMLLYIVCIIGFILFCILFLMALVNCSKTIGDFG